MSATVPHPQSPLFRSTMALHMEGSRTWSHICRILSLVLPLTGRPQERVRPRHSGHDNNHGQEAQPRLEVGGAAAVADVEEEDHRQREERYRQAVQPRLRPQSEQLVEH